MPGKTNFSSRMHMLDALRGLCVVCMVVYHFLFNMSRIFHTGWGTFLYNFFTPAAPYVAGIFIFLCGISCRLSRSNFKRALIILAAAALVTLVTASPFIDMYPIWFGILHLLGISVLIFAMTRPVLDMLWPALGIFLCAALFLITRQLYVGYLGIAPWAYTHVSWNMPQALSLPLGVNVTALTTPDYFPILPWIFILLAGTYFGKWLKGGSKLLSRNPIPPLAFIGRRALIIYLLHQPVLYGAAWLVFRLIND